jgi:hypothetical protein
MNRQARQRCGYIERIATAYLPFTQFAIRVSLDHNYMVILTW